MRGAGKFDGKLVKDVRRIAQPCEQDDGATLPSPIEHL
jgi:hypothetical protein